MKRGYLAACWRCSRSGPHGASGCRAVINRFGFNSAGVDVVGANLAAFRDRTNYEPARSLRPGLVGVNLGKNKVSCTSLLVLPLRQSSTQCQGWYRAVLAILEHWTLR